MKSVKLRAVTLILRIYDGVPEMLFESGSKDGPAYVIGRQEIATVIREAIEFYKSTRDTARLPDSVATVSMDAPAESMDRLLTVHEVEAITRMKKSSIYSARRAGTFPEPRQISRRKVLWVERDVLAWVNGTWTSTKAAP